MLEQCPEFLSFGNSTIICNATEGKTRHTHTQTQRTCTKISTTLFQIPAIKIPISASFLSVPQLRTTTDIDDMSIDIGSTDRG